MIVATPFGREAIEEISAAADMPVGTAKCYAHRGRSRLRDKLSDVA
jgi:DNA-directed RNA polymerase specialized sigma24 family protein